GGRGARWYDDVVLMAGLPTVGIGGAIGDSRLVGGVLLGGGFFFGGVALLVEALTAGLTAGTRSACFIMAGCFIPLGLLFGYLQLVAARREEKTRERGGRRGR